MRGRRSVYPGTLAEESLNPIHHKVVSWLVFWVFGSDGEGGGRREEVLGKIPRAK
jgi:hypothetical protein